MRPLRLRGKLLLVSAVLLALPWLGYRYLQETRQFLYAGQERAQTLAAQALATVLPARLELYTTAAAVRLDEAEVFYAYPLTQPIEIDGYGEDWKGLRDHARRFAEHGDLDLGFDLVMGVRDDHLYLFLHVDDERIVYRHPGGRRLDDGDHVRLALIDPRGQLQRLLITTDGPGAVAAYPVGPDWGSPLTERPLRGPSGQWQPLDTGYDLELALPLSLLGPTRRLRLEVADVDDPKTRSLEGVLGTLPADADTRLNNVVLRSPELEAMLHGLERSGARMWVVDRDGRVRAQAGTLGSPGLRDLTVETERRQEPSVRQALAGRAAIERRPTADGHGEIIMATYPIRSEQEVRGAVVVEQGTGDILALQRRALERLGLVTLGVGTLLVTALMLFASRLAYRIRRLNREANAAIDPLGRIHHGRLRAEDRAGDELGDLSRNITALLQRLTRYTRFLEGMPRMLRHEINNPLNAISTSLQNLGADTQQLGESPYMHSAQRGVSRIGRIVQALTEAASLEDALRSEARAPLALDALLRDYVTHCRIQYPQRRFALHMQGGPCVVMANDFRMEQLLDKLTDNAVDFAPEGGLIEFALDRAPPWVELSVHNEGPGLSPRLAKDLFDSLVSARKGEQRDVVHMGMGLYVVRTIAEHHGGGVRAYDYQDPSGVAVVVRLPAAHLRNA
jgi:two-component system sensor histidine kinase ChvG